MQGIDIIEGFSSPTLKKDADQKGTLTIDFEVEMKDQRWIFDLPSVTMRDQRVVLGLPEIRMNTRSFSFDLPEIRMVDKKVGQYPETEVDGFNVTVRWKDIITSVPETVMVRHEFKTDIPETTMKDQDIIFGLPEVTMQRQEWVLKIPEFKLKKIDVAGAPVYNDYTKRGDEIKSDSDDLKSDMKSDLVTRTHKLYSCLRADTSAKMEEASKSIVKGINQIDSSFAVLAEKGIQGREVIVDVNGVKTTLGAQRDQLAQALADLSKKLATTLATFDQNEKEAVDKVTAS